MTEITFSDAVVALHPGARVGIDFLVVDHSNGQGPQLWDWRLGSQRPTHAEILAALADGRAAVAAKPRYLEFLREEASERILAVFPDWRQRNMTARGVELLAIRMARTWTAGEQAEVNELTASWDWIKSVRVASNQLELFDVVPDDFRGDKYWPAPPA